MSWSPHQQALLRGLGLRVWQPAPQRAEEPAKSPTPTPSSSVTTRPAVAAAAAAEEPMRTAPPTPKPSAVPLQLAKLDWPALRQAVADCTACGLCSSRKQTVFGVGHREAHWLVVGEAPGEQEDLQGQPFVGPAGQLLDRMLAALQLTRSEEGAAPSEQRVYITNTLKCRPPRNRNPAPEEMAQCEPFLLRQIELLKPRIILAMGAFAVKALLNSDEPVGKLRGRVHQYHGTPLVVTYHPSYLLRQPAEKAKSWVDLCLAAQVAEQTRLER
jgi:uracil-DNA glycosylase